MPNRMLKESIKTSDQIDALTAFEEVVFYRILVTVDDFGCMEGKPVIVKNQLFPTKENVTTKSIRDALTKLESTGLLRIYYKDDHPYIYVCKFGDHQRLRNRVRKFPNPDECLSATCGQLSATCGQASADCDKLPLELEEELELELELEEELKPKKKERTAFDASLDEFKKYRKQMGKKLTPLAETKLLNELERLAPGDDSAKIAILDRSICNGWTGVFPLKGKKDHGYQEHPSGNLDALLVDLDAEGGEPDATSKWTAV